MTETFFSDARLPVIRVRQKRDWFCGPACAEMILQLYGKSISQESAYQTIHDETRFSSEMMYSDPFGLTAFINANNDDLQMLDVMEVSKTDVGVVIQAIFGSLYGDHFPVVALVQGGGHWIVISGVRYSHSLQGSNQFCGVYVENPWRDTSPGVYVPLEEFTGRWLTPNQYGKTWKDHVIVLTDAKAQTRANVSIVSSMVAAPQLGATVRSQGPLGHGFTHFREIAGGGAPITKPMLVIDEDTGYEFYLEPYDFTNEISFKDFVYVASDKNTGLLLEITPMSGLLDIPSDEEALTAVRRAFPQAAISVDPKYYWRRSPEIKLRADVYRRALVDGLLHFVLRDGSVKDQLPTFDARGG